MLTFYIRTDMVVLETAPLIQKSQSLESGSQEYQLWFINSKLLFMYAKLWFIYAKLWFMYAKQWFIYGGGGVCIASHWKRSKANSQSNHSNLTLMQFEIPDHGLSLADLFGPRSVIGGFAELAGSRGDYMYEFSV